MRYSISALVSRYHVMNECCCALLQAQQVQGCAPPLCVNLMATFSPVLRSRASFEKLRPLWLRVLMLVYLGLPAKGSEPQVAMLAWAHCLQGQNSSLIALLHQRQMNVQIYNDR
jgi:hypothetical protein